MDEDNKDVVNQIQSISASKRKMTAKNLSPRKFIDLVAKEYGSINRVNKMLKKMEKFIFSDEFVFGLDAKDQIKLIEVLLKYKHTSLNFLARLYEVSTKNDILRSYFEEKIDSKTEIVKQDQKIRKIVSEIKLRVKEEEIRNQDENNT